MGWIQLRNKPMESNPRVRVKICCIGSVEEAQLAIAHGASAVGLVSRMPSGPGVIAEDLIAEIVASVPPGVASFLLTSEIDVPAIIDQQRRTRVNTLQLVDALQAGAHQQLREALPGIAIVQVVHVVGEQSIAEAIAIAPHVDSILLDSGNPAAPVKELGGTGRIHNWEISRGIRQSIHCPLFVAGGLQPANVREAIRQIGPYGLDVCGGVRTNGKLDAAKLRDFFREVEAANNASH
jgi:phosphoribosylanthranilate isomerase